jgi:1-acyl-sn-glycerol-3-phosphate acyltransferase
MVSFPRARLGVTYRSAASILRPILLTNTVRAWSGQENIPHEGVGFIAVSNHISHVDPLLVLHYLYDNGRAPRVLAKDSLFDVPALGQVMQWSDMVPVSRGTSDASAALEAAAESLRRGECLLVFPEGTLTRDPDLWPMRGKTGTARLALSTGCPVVPIGHWGVHRINRPYSLKVTTFPPKEIAMAAGPAVHLDDLRDREVDQAVLNEATTRIMRRIVDIVAGLRGEEPPPDVLTDSRRGHIHGRDG